MRDEEDQARGFADLESLFKANNSVFCFGCKPSNGVPADTKMIDDLSKALLTNYNCKTMICTIPEVLEGLKGEDSNFELTVSSSILPVDLFYTWNTIVKSIGVIFVFTEVYDRAKNKSIEFKEAGISAEERGKIAREVFQS